MEQPPIFSATLGLSPPWHIRSMSFSKEERRVDIDIDFANGSTFTCPICGEDVPVCKTENETWHHHDFFLFTAYLHARVPVVRCFSCGMNAVKRPWALGSEFTFVKEA